MSAPPPTPQTAPGRVVQHIALADLLATVTPAWPSTSHCPTWQDARDYLLENELEEQRVQDLALEIAQRGLRCPIYIVPADEDDPQPSVGDGMHRILAAERAGLLEVPVIYHLPNNAPEVASRTYVTISLTSNQAGLEDEIYDDLSSLVSFRLDEQTWVQSDGYGGLRTVAEDGSVELVVDLWWTTHLAGREASLEVALRERLTRHEIPVTTIVTVDDSYDDDPCDEGRGDEAEQHGAGRT